MTESIPRVSIGMPLFNAENYVDEAIESVLGQSFSDFELIISDNASSDETLDLCQSWAKKDSRVRVVESSENLGAAWNYNRTVEMATAGLFRWQAHDDRCDLDMLRRLVLCFEQDPEIVLAYTHTRLIDQQGDEIRVLHDHLAVDSPRVAKRYRNIICNLNDCNSVFGLIDINVLRSTSVIAPYTSSDRALLFELSLRGRFAEIPEPMFERRRHLGSSLRAAKTRTELEQWFDPRKSKGSLFPGLTLFVRHLRNLLKAPIGRRDRIKCVMVLFVYWPVAHARSTRRRLKRDWRVMRNREVKL